MDKCISDHSIMGADAIALGPPGLTRQREAPIVRSNTFETSVTIEQVLDSSGVQRTSTRMTLATALPVLQETAAPERVGELPAARVAEVRALVAREMGEVEDLVRARLDEGVSPGDGVGAPPLRRGRQARSPARRCSSRRRASDRSTSASRDLAAAAELVHMATLLHDDVIDDGDQRRGRPTSRRVWGNAVSVLAGDMLLVEALRLASADGGAADEATWTELVATLGRLVDGEIVQLRGRVAVSLDEATYFEIVRGKTASLFEWALRAGARAAAPRRPRSTRSAASAEALGVAFQLVDDLLDYDGDAAATGKTLFADLAEGKVTLPLIRAARPAIGAGDRSLVARVREGDEAAARELGVCVRDSGACERVRQLARGETDRALAELAVVPACPAQRGARRRRARTRRARLLKLEHTIRPVAASSAVGPDPCITAYTDGETDAVGKEKHTLWPSEAAVSDVVGRLIEFWGFKRNMGRIWAVLYLSPEPLSAEDLRAGAQALERRGQHDAERALALGGRAQGLGAG